MNVFDIQFKSKTVGLVILISSFLILLLTIVASVFLISLGFGSGVGMLTLLPFSILAFLALLVSGLGVYIGIGYLNGKEFKRNQILGTFLVVLGAIYFLSSLVSCLFSNLTGNSGGEFQPVIALLWAVLTIPFGLVLKNGCKEQ